MSDTELELAQANAEPGVQVRRCIFGDNLVYLASDAPADEVANPRCIVHYFDADPTADYEREP